MKGKSCKTFDIVPKKIFFSSLILTFIAAQPSIPIAMGAHNILNTFRGKVTVEMLGYCERQTCSCQARSICYL